ncbi:hypothetical protein N1030_13545 [Desulfovibrio mangrovi]|nr:hypothetical protein [Desulfovibrio mangrovi]UZP66625.1 hypothetical protein N1030_13545 [Desulfovibrio mangrovi]
MDSSIDRGDIPDALRLFRPMSGEAAIVIFPIIVFFFACSAEIIYVLIS